MFVLRFFVSFLSLSSIAVFAGPVVETKRSDDVSTVMDVVNNLQSRTNLILPEINSLLASGIASKDTIMPLVSSIVTSMNSAHSSLSTFTAAAATDTADNVGNVMGAIVSDITDTLHNAQVAIPDLTDVLEELGLDPAINQILSGIETLVIGVLNFIAKLAEDGGLFDLANFLNELALVLVLDSLGL